MTLNKTKILNTLKFIWILSIIGSLMATPFVIWTGWQTATDMVEQWWIKQIFVSKTHLDFHARELWELPIDQQIDRIYGTDARMAHAVFQAESGKRCDAVSHTGDIGPAQINVAIHAKRAYALGFDLMDCTQNLQFGRVLQQEQGWTPWVAHNNLSYLKFLTH